MVDLLSLQRDIHARLNQFAPCFLRVCNDDYALWVSDLSRKPSFSAETAAALSAPSLSFMIDDNSLLLYIDLSDSFYAKLSASLPRDVPAFPDENKLLPLYSLSRLLLRHPADLARQPMELNRRILKYLFHPKLFKENEIQAIHSECALLLRRNMPLPYLGGCLLAARLSQKGDSPCFLST